MDGRAKPLGIALVSGGMDSLVMAAFCRRESELALLHVNYGQRTEARELACFDAIAEFLEVPPSRRLVADIGYLKAIGGSALTDTSIDVPAADLERKEAPVTTCPSATRTWWPSPCRGRGHRREEHLHRRRGRDSSGYPDCRPEFYEAMNEAIRLGTKEGGGITVKAPLIGLKKKDIVRMGLSMGVPFEHSWSCYREARKACGVCDSCALRLRAFAEADAVDPLPYETRPDYR
jgi:7-cyano-7-deazaguanine synthase